jgi:hypothetical protein
MGRRFTWTVLATALLLAAGVMAFNYRVDPFEQYRKAERHPPRYYPAWQRWQNPGLARNYDYDRVVTGSSLMENVLPEEVDRVLGGRTINLSVSAQTAYDAGQLLGVALATGKTKQVLMNLDYNAFSGDPLRSGFTEPFPAFLYDDRRWNDLPYLLGVGTTRKSLETVLGLRWTRYTTDPNRMWYWADGYRFSAAKAVQGLEPSNLNARFRQPQRTLQGMQASFEANLVPLIERYPGTRFTFLYAPYAILVWLDFQQRRQLEVTLAFREWAYERTRGYPNVEIFDFHAEPSIVLDLDNFTDIYHFSPKLSRGILEAMAQGRYRLTPEMVRGNNAWIRRAVRETTPERVIAEARARPAPATPDGKYFVPGGGLVPPASN